VESGTNNFALSAETIAPQDHVNRVALHAETEFFNAAIKRLIPSGKHVEITALFEGRAAYATIKGWRLGWRRPAQWAIDLLAAKLHARADVDTALAARIRQIKAPQPINNIAKWNARRAAQKAAGASKEKAGD
jgi:hypothetical protein